VEYNRAMHLHNDVIKPDQDQDPYQHGSTRDKCRIRIHFATEDPKHWHRGKYILHFSRLCRNKTEQNSKIVLFRATRALVNADSDQVEKTSTLWIQISLSLNIAAGLLATSCNSLCRKLV
jgi:hypothetical protein